MNTSGPDTKKALIKWVCRIKLWKKVVVWPLLGKQASQKAVNKRAAEKELILSPQV